MESKIPFNCVHICRTDCHRSNCGEIENYDAQYPERWSVELLVIVEIVVKYRVTMREVERGAPCHHINSSEIQLWCAIPREVEWGSACHHRT